MRHGVEVMTGPLTWGFEVDDMDSVAAELRSRGVEFEPFDIAGFEVEDGIVTVPDNFFRDSEGNLLALGQALR